MSRRRWLSDVANNDRRFNARMAFELCCRIRKALSVARHQDGFAPGFDEPSRQRQADTARTADYDHRGFLVSHGLPRRLTASGL